MSSTTTGIHSESPLLTSPNLPPVSETEARGWYYGLPSRPKLIARIGSVLFELVPSFDAGFPDHPESKELRVVGEHKIRDVWEDGLAHKIHALLDEKQVDWTSTDVVRIGSIEDPTKNFNKLKDYVVLWIGVVPESLSYERGIDVAVRCKRVLVDDYGIEDVDVEIRASRIVKAAGARPRLFEPASRYRNEFEKTEEVMETLAYTLGIPIYGKDTQEVEGTAGFFLNEKGEGEGDGGRLLLVTARHVVLPDLDDDEGFECMEEREERKRHDVLVLNDALFKKHVAAVEQAIWLRDMDIDSIKERLASLLNVTGEQAEKRRKNAQMEGEQAEKAAEALTEYRELLKHWATEDSRVLGQVLYSPPMDVDSTSGYARDVAVIAVDPDKVDPASFPGNMIDLGPRREYGLVDIFLMMPRNPKNVHSCPLFSSPHLGLRGVVPEEEMRKPVDYDEDGNPCIGVLMRGATSGLKTGRANSIFSYTRDDKGRVSKQWPILPIPKAQVRNRNYGRCTTFGEVGDSGAVVVDVVGRIGGIVACGAGDREWEFDVTYVTPVGAVLDFVKAGKGLEGVKVRDGPDEKTLRKSFLRMK